LLKIKPYNTILQKSIGAAVRAEGRPAKVSTR